MPPKRKRNKIFLEFSFTHVERDNILKYCLLEDDIARRFRKIVPVGSDIVVVFDKAEANEMMISLSHAINEVSGNTDLKKKFEDLHDRFREKYNSIFSI